MAPRMVRQIRRRDLLHTIGVAGLVGTTSTHVSASKTSTPGGTRESLGDPGRSSSSAADWTTDALWDVSGTTTGHPLQVMHPGDTLRTYRTLTAYDATDGFDAELAAENTARLQVDGDGKFSLVSGGFDSIAGDIGGPWVYSTWAGVVFADTHSIDINRDAAATFLKRMQRDVGGFGAHLSFFGYRPTAAKMESTYYALETLQRLDALDAETERAARKFLLTFQQSDGAWPVTEYKGDATIGSTYDALRALDSIDSLPAKAAQQAAAFVRDHQHADGGFYNVSSGWGWFEETDDDASTEATQKDTTVLSTSRAVLALDFVDELAALGDDRIQAHADWLAARQLPATADTRRAGAFEKWATPGKEAAVPNHRQYTRHALDALQVLEAHGATVDIDYERAFDYLRRCQNENTGGVGMWPTYLAKTDATVAATKAITDLDAGMPADALAASFSRLQKDSGRIPLFGSLGSRDGYKTRSTGKALVALAAVDRLDAIDVDAAADHIASLQQDDGYWPASERGGSFKAPPPDLPATTSSILGLAAAGELDRIDTQAAVDFLAGLQDKAGRLARYATLNTLVGDTARSVRALDALGHLDAIDVDRTTDYFASLASDGGRYWPSPAQAGWAIHGLATADALDAIDVDATRDYLERNQSSAGGYAGQRFYRVYTAVEQHAAVVAALELLGGSHDESAQNPRRTVAGTHPGTPSGDDRVLVRVPSQGWRWMTVDDVPAEELEGETDD